MSRAQGRVKSVNEKYISLSDRDHILNRPESILGSANSISRPVSIYDGTTFVTKEVTCSAASERIFIEVLTNALDNVERSRDAGVDPKRVEVVMTTEVITVINYGLPVDVAMHETGMYVPELVFGVCRSGSNYDDNEKRSVAGRNGYGAKGTNIMSKVFAIDVIDASRGLRYKQVWTDNKGKTGKPVITETKEPSRTVVKFKPDLARLGRPEGKYLKEDLLLFRTLCIYAAYTAQIPVIFNNKEYNFPKNDSFVKTLFPDIENCIFFENEHLRVTVLDTPNNGQVHSFVNNIITRKGGLHVNTCYENIFSTILDTINSKNVDKLSRQKGTDIKGAELRAFKVYMNHVTPHVSLIVVAKGVDKPEFESQSKEMLTHPPIQADFDYKKCKKVMNWKLIDCLNEVLLNKVKSRLKKTDGKFTSRVRLKNPKTYNRANFAGEKGKDYMSTALFLVEGESASCHIDKLISFIKNGSDYFGSLQLKGKPPNITKNVLAVEDCEEYIAIKSVTGIKEDVDYTLAKNRRNLNYGKIIIAADADDDGNHIVSLVLNFFYRLYPSLIECGYIQIYRTPTVKLFPKNKRSKTLSFYNLNSFTLWCETGDLSKYNRPKYYKGLGTSTREDIKEYAKNLLKVTFEMDDETAEAMDVSFNTKRSNERKEIIRNADSNYVPIIEGNCSVTDFLRNELVDFWVMCLERAIPGIDGLKDVTRKLMYTSLKYFPEVKKFANRYPTKTLVFNGRATEMCAYARGDASINKAIVSLAQSFTGSNNIPLIGEVGQFGSRKDCGKKAADARYTSVKECPLIQYIYNPIDLEYYERKVDDGVQIESKYLLSVLPVCVINGIEGIACGSSTNIQSYNPLDLYDWYMARLDDKPYGKILVPWYRGFNGLVEIERTEQDGHFIDTIGIHGLHRKEGSTVYIDELPVKVKVSSVTKVLDKMIDEKLISNYTVNDNDEISSFVIYDWLDEIDYVTELKLFRMLKLSNIVILDRNNLPKRYDIIDDYLEDFLHFRLEGYQLRKNYLLAGLRKKEQNCDDRMKIIDAVLEGKLVTRHQHEKDVENRVSELQLNYEIYKKLFDRNFNKTESEKYRAQLIQLREQIQNLIDTSPIDMWKTELNQFKQAYCKHYKVSQ